MGILDDAIREHLELRRRHGASDEEVERQKEEALGRITRAQSAQEALEREQGAREDPGGQPSTDAPPSSSEEAPPDEGEPDELEPEAVRFAPDSDLDALQADELEPDEVLPEESLEPGPPPGDFRRESRSFSETAGNDQPEDWDRSPAALEPEVDEDVLEETPEFLEETPEQDRLWFEQKPPKDFDFGD